MKFSMFLNPQIPGSGYGAQENAQARRSIGRDTESYQRLLDEVWEIAVLADQTGFDALMLTEHHFHSEGFEFSVNTLMVLTDLAARTEGLLLAPLGLVLPTWDPIRAAEDVAPARPVLQGPAAARRRARVPEPLGQRARPALARRCHPERRIHHGRQKLRRLWRDLEDHENGVDPGDHPLPERGARRLERALPVRGCDQLAGRRVDQDVRRTCRDRPGQRAQAVSVCPRPYQNPHPELWQPFTISNRSIVRCAQEGILPWMFVPHPDDHKAKCELYQAECAKHGRDYALGERTGILKIVATGEDRAETIRKYDG